MPDIFLGAGKRFSRDGLEGEASGLLPQLCWQRR